MENGESGLHIPNGQGLVRPRVLLFACDNGIPGDAIRGHVLCVQGCSMAQAIPCPFWQSLYSMHALVHGYIAADP